MRSKKRFAVRTKSVSQRALVIWFILSLSFFMILSFLLFITTSVKKNDLTLLQNYEQRLLRDITLIGSLKKEQKNLEIQKKDVTYKVHKLKKVGAITQNTPHHYLQEVAQIIPEHIVLLSFSFDTKGMTLEGTSFNVAAITHFMRALAQSKRFKGPKLVSMNKNEESTAGDVKFIIHVLKR